MHVNLQSQLQHKFCRPTLKPSQISYDTTNSVRFKLHPNVLSMELTEGGGENLPRFIIAGTEQNAYTAFTNIIDVHTNFGLEAPRHSK